MSAKRPGTQVGWWLLAVLAVVGAGVLGLRHYETRVLREQLDLLENEVGVGRALQAKGRELTESVPSEEALQRLRAERAAAVRLREEIDGMNARAERAERAMSGPHSVARE